MVIETTNIASSTAIEIKNVTRRFGQKLALDNVSLSVPRGRVFGLVGGNEAGKTTLLKHLMGMLQAQSGSVRVFGLDPIAQPVSVLKNRVVRSVGASP